MPTALIIVDVQRDFCAGGALAVPDGDAVVPIINRLRETLKPALVALTVDWHPADHTSFAANNPGQELFQKRADGQMMWPVHCVQNTVGARFHERLLVVPGDQCFFKGTQKDVDSYSGFGSEPRKDGSRAEQTALGRALLDAGITDVVVVGLAFDYCVAATAKDAAFLGFRTSIIQEATRAVAESSAADAEADLIAAGVTIVRPPEEKARSVRLPPDASAAAP